jgi:hypothetical protein
MKNKNISIGLAFGVIIGLVYVVLLLLRWRSAENLIVFGAMAILSFAVLIGVMFYEAHYRRKENGGSISLKELFQTLFVSVLVFELFYAIFNFVYLKYIDPGVVDRMKDGMVTLMDKAGDQITEADKAKRVAELDKFQESTQPLKVLQGYLLSVAISGVVALLISLIMRRKPKIQFDTP